MPVTKPLKQGRRKQSEQKSVQDRPESKNAVYVQAPTPSEIDSHRGEVDQRDASREQGIAVERGDSRGPPAGHK